MIEQAPTRDKCHEALAMFLGEWTASGTSFGGSDQTGDPRANGESWSSKHRANWHTGEFFLIQDERALIGGTTFDTLSVLGVDPHTGGYFSRGFENHGFYRHYRMGKDGRVWTLEGHTERARIEFSQDGCRQQIEWEWKPEDRWLPLCDRVAVRTN